MTRSTHDAALREQRAAMSHITLEMLAQSAIASFEALDSTHTGELMPSVFAESFGDAAWFGVLVSMGAECDGVVTRDAWLSGVLSRAAPRATPRAEGSGEVEPRHTAKSMHPTLLEMQRDGLQLSAEARTAQHATALGAAHTETLAELRAQAKAASIERLGHFVHNAAHQIFETLCTEESVAARKASSDDDTFVLANAHEIFADDPFWALLVEGAAPPGSRASSARAPLRMTPGAPVLLHSSPLLTTDYYVSFRSACDHLTPRCRIRRACRLGRERSADHVFVCCFAGRCDR